MNEKDRQIERLFDEYGSSLQPNTSLTGKAAEKIRDKKPPKRSNVIWGSIIAASGSALAVVLAVFALIGRFGSGEGGNGESDDTPMQSVISYNINGVKARKVDASFAADYLNTDIPTDAQIYSQSYYACYIKDTGEFAYLKAVFGISYNGGNIQMSVVAEKSNYRGKELSDEYGYLMHGSGYRYDVERICGEYVTMAYLKTDEYKYYVSAMGNVSGAQDIAEHIVKA